jgi:hypothetical protein
VCTPTRPVSGWLSPGSPSGRYGGAYMTTQDQDPPNFFDELDIGLVKSHVIELAEEYNKNDMVINRIVLYKAGYGSPVGTKYVILFELSKSENNDQGFSEHAKVIRNIMIAGQNSAFASKSDYKKFYKKNSPDQPWTEWELKFKAAGSMVDFKIVSASKKILYESSSWILWDVKSQEGQESFYEKVRNQFNIPENISNQNIQKYIEYNFSSDEDEDREAFDKACEMDDLQEQKGELVRLTPKSITEIKIRDEKLEDIDRKLKALKDYFDDNTSKNDENADVAIESQLSINELIICAESDEEISIREPRKKKIPFRYDNADFRYNNSDSKDWKCFIGTLRTPPHRYQNVAGTDRRRSRLNRINKKLTALINHYFSNVKIPDNGKLYELYKGGESGIYKFKFKIESVYSESESLDQLQKKYQKKSKEDLISLLTDKIKAYAETPSNYLREENEAITNILLEKHNLTKEKISDHILGKTNRELINEEFSNFNNLYKEDINAEVKYPEKNSERSK